MALRCGPHRHWRDFRSFVRIQGLTRVRLHSAIDHLTPADTLNEMEPMILEQCEQRLGASSHA